MGKQRYKVTPRFVEQIPPGKRESGVILVCIKYGVMSLACPCGCGLTMDLSIEPHRWRIEWDGEHLSVCPSVSSSGLPCRSHYWIQSNRIEWCRPISHAAERRKERIEDEARRAVHGGRKATRKKGNIWRRAKERLEQYVRK